MNARLALAGVLGVLGSIALHLIYRALGDDATCGALFLFGIGYAQGSVAARRRR